MRPTALTATFLLAVVAIALPSPAMAEARVSVSNDKGSRAIDPVYATTLTLRGSGFQSIANGHGGIYVFFGTVKGTWRPSQGGQTGRDVFYVPDSEARNNAGYQKFVAFPGSDTSGSANGGTIDADGTWSTKIKVPGATFRARDRDNNVATIDCRKVTCGIITVGAHGVKNASNETFTPVDVKTLYEQNSDSDDSDSDSDDSDSRSTATAAPRDISDTATDSSASDDAEPIAASVPRLKVDRATAIAGHAMTFTATGLPAGEQAVATLDNGIATVGPLSAGPNGSLVGVISLPVGLDPGTHTLRLTSSSGAPTVSFGVASSVGENGETPVAAVMFAASAGLILLLSVGFAAWRLRMPRRKVTDVA